MEVEEEQELVGGPCKAASQTVSAVVAPLDTLLAAAVPLASQDAHVGPPEGGVAQGVAHGVDGGVDVAQVVREVPQLSGDTVILTG